MCGIAGVLLGHPSFADPATLAAVGPMTDRLRHRGPSDKGLWIDEAAGIALGHRRLSILDLSPAGHQPMVSQSGRFVASYNGEIYNFLDLRPELEALGCVFRGGSDTEVLLAAWEAWGGERALERFAGMFALAVWDRRDRVLHLARDRFGKKPLYVARLKGGVAFASELKAFQGLPGFEPTLDTDGLAAFLRQGWIGDPHCIWAEAFKLPPGSCLAIRADSVRDRCLDDLRAGARRWWRLEDVIAEGAADPCTGSVAEITEELDRLLRLSVSQRMISDVPLGAFLSGGVDSSLVVALMQQLSARPVRTYTIGFGEAQYDESAQSAEVAAHLGTDHTTFRVTASQAQAAIPDLPQVWDEPFADDSQIPTLLLARLARRDVTVALSGDGGDEGFGGYARHFLYSRLSPILRMPAGLRRTAAGCITALSPVSWDDWLRAAHVPVGWHRALRREKLHKLADLITARDAHAWYDRVTTFRSADGGMATKAFPFPGLADPLTQILYRDATEYLPGDILVKVDRATMATGLECRAPLLDHRLVAYAWRIPNALKMRDGQGKWILRQVLRRYVPDRLMKPKSGFDVPVGAWLRGPLRPWAEALILDLVRRDHPLIDGEAIASTWAEHCSGRCDRSREVWALTMLAAWMQHWRQHAPVADAADAWRRAPSAHMPLAAQIAQPWSA